MTHGVPSRAADAATAPSMYAEAAMQQGFMQPVCSSVQTPNVVGVGKVAASFKTCGTISAGVDAEAEMASPTLVVLEATEDAASSVSDKFKPESDEAAETGFLATGPLPRLLKAIKWVFVSKVEDMLWLKVKCRVGEEVN